MKELCCFESGQGISRASESGARLWRLRIEDKDKRLNNYVHRKSKTMLNIFYKYLYIILFVVIFSDNLSANSEGELIIIIKDSSDYSFEFLKELENSNIDRIIEKEGNPITLELIDDKMILGKYDTTGFSSFLPVGEKMKFFGENGNNRVQLSVQRINYTSIAYSVLIVSNGKDFYQDGVATIHQLFFLGAESNENGYTGMSYFVDEYHDRRCDSCYMSIRVGYDDEFKKGLGKVIMNCLPGIEDINLDNCPTLVEY